MIDPGVVSRALNAHRDGGGLARELAIGEHQLQTISDQQQNIARQISRLRDDAAADPLLAELRTLAISKRTAEQEVARIRQRLAETAEASAQVRSLMAWCPTVAANLDAMSYDEQRLTLSVLGVRVDIYRPGSVDQHGKPVPRWILYADPARYQTDVPTILGPHILYGSPGRATPAPGSGYRCDR